MIGLLKNESSKFFLKKWLIYTFIIFFSTISLNILMYVSSNVPSNITFLELINVYINPIGVLSGLMSILIPIISIVICSNIFCEEQESGIDKYIIISNIKRRKFITSKVLFCLFVIIINSITFFICTTILSGILTRNFRGVFTLEYLQIFLRYLYCNLGILPFVFLVGLLSVLFNKFDKVVAISLVVFIVFYIIDNILMKFSFFSISNPIIHLMYLFGSKVQRTLSLITVSLYSIIMYFLSLFYFKRKEFWI